MSDYDLPPFGVIDDLPYEAGVDDPQDLQYDDLGQPDFPEEDWRMQQLRFMQSQYPAVDDEQNELDDEPYDEEATNG